MQHKFLTLAAAVAAAWVFGLPALAAGGAGVYGSVQGQDAVLYLRSGSADAAYTCMVGNTPVTPAKATPLSGLDTPAHTVILLDNSAAIPESQRDIIHDILNGLAGTRLNGETFTLDTLGAEVTPLCDGETDYLQLKTVVDSLTYNDHTAQLTDCVYRVLDSLVQQNSPALTRVVPPVPRKNSTATPGRNWPTSSARPGSRCTSSARTTAPTPPGRSCRNCSPWPA